VTILLVAVIIMGRGYYRRYRYALVRETVLSVKLRCAEIVKMK
jgi:hypothetical protein